MAKTTDKPRKGLVGTIAEKIRTAIVDAELDFGESLSEDALATAFEVSRTPVREALNLLQMEGLVHIVPKSGTYVFTPTAEEIAELCDFRAGLEQQAVMLIPDDGIPRVVARLEMQLETMIAAIAAADMQAYGRADTAFHWTFFEDCGNRYLRNAYNLVLGRVAALRTHLAIRAEGEPDRSFQDHREMIALLAGGQRDKLADMLKAHILRTKDNYVNAFEKLPIASSDTRALRLRRRLAIANDPVPLE